MKNLLVIIAAIFAIFLSTSVSAVLIGTTDGVINSTAGTVSIGASATYISGGTGLTGYGNTWPADAGDGLGNVSQEASNIDRYWLQFNSSTASQAGSIQYLFGGATDTVVAVAGIDHGPTPYESLEFIIWGWTGNIWEEGAITAIYDQGVDAAWAYDDFSSVWSFSNSYTRFAVSGGSHLIGYGGTEGEIDGLAMLSSSIPEPSSLALLALGMLGFGYRYKKQFQS
jgi:PEP-CTERM motif-containing protein